MSDPRERDHHTVSDERQARLRSRFLGCLLGGATGDALGAPIENARLAEIRRRYGPNGLDHYVPAFGGLGRITDDTQMTLFTAEGLIRAWVRDRLKGISSYSGVTAHAYLRWLRTQGVTPLRAHLVFGAEEPGWLIQHEALHSARSPGNTCLAALRDMTSLGAPAENDSKGCGAVMRMAPMGLFARSLGLSREPQRVFDAAVEIAAITHGHPTGQLPAGVFAVLILKILDGLRLPDALRVAIDLLCKQRGHEETLAALALAQRLATSEEASDMAPHVAIARIGQGWVADEALAIAVYCALKATDFKQGVVAAVNHDGDSDSTGSIAGNLLGTIHGVEAIPAPWLEQLELRETIAEIASDLFAFTDWEFGSEMDNREQFDAIWRKYPGF